MIGLWLLYTLLVGAALFALGLLLERIAVARRWPTRHGWLAVMLLATLLSAWALPGRGSDARVGEPGARTDARPGAARSTNVEARVGGAMSIPAPRLRVPPLPRAWERVVRDVVAYASLLSVLLVMIGACCLDRWIRSLPVRHVAGRRARVSRAFGPAASGIRHPELVVPRWILTLPRAQQHLVVEHEHAHAEAGDPLVARLGLLLAALQPWNPIAWLMLGRLRLAMELDCDARVLARHDFTPARVRAYGHLLLEAQGRSHRSASLLPAFWGGPPSLHRRLHAMTAPRDRHRIPPHVAAAAVLCGALALTFSLDAQPPRPDTPPRVVRRGAPADSYPTFQPDTGKPKSPRRIVRVGPPGQPPQVVLRKNGKEPPQVVGVIPRAGAPRPDSAPTKVPRVIRKDGKEYPVFVPVTPKGAPRLIVVPRRDTTAR